jgi:hypothetical protein
MGVAYEILAQDNVYDDIKVFHNFEREADTTITRSQSREVLIY